MKLRFLFETVDSNVPSISKWHYVKTLDLQYGFSLFHSVYLQTEYFFHQFHESALGLVVLNDLSVVVTNDPLHLLHQISKPTKPNTKESQNNVWCSHFNIKISTTALQYTVCQLTYSLIKVLTFSGQDFTEESKKTEGLN